MDELHRWEDVLRARLFERRTVVVSGHLGDGRTSDLAAELMTLDALGDDPVELYLDGVTATIEAALALVDTIDVLGVPVHVTCLGTVEGPAVAIAAVCARRRIGVHARLRLCDPKAAFDGSAADLERWAAHHQRQVHDLYARLAAATGRPLERVEADVRTGVWLSADDAVAYGLVDEVARPGLPPRARPFGFVPPPPPDR